MKLSEILSISGQPGLHKYVAQSKGGIIVESLSDQKRFPVGGAAKVSSLSDIAIFTQSEDLALAEVFQKIYVATSGKEVVSPKGLSNEELKATMKQYLPDYDEDRVHVSDMKKLFTWYNILIGAGFTTFIETQQEQEDDAASTVKANSVAEVTKPKAKVKNSNVQANTKAKSTTRVRAVKAS